MERQPGPDVVGAAHAAEDAHQLKSTSQPEPRDTVRRHPGNISSGKKDGSGIRTQQARHQVEHGGLA
jgi:hypothetical protein